MVDKTVGTDSVRAQFLFFKANLHNDTRAVLQKRIVDILRTVRNQIENKDITSFTAFIEIPFNKSGAATAGNYAIPGNINWLSVENVESVLTEKLKHASPEYRKKGMVSTHPPKFLTLETLVIVMGSTKFLLRNMQLYLEQEGLLRDKTFELLIDIACIDIARGRKRDDFLHLFIRDKTWYRGNVEALADFVSKQYQQEESVGMTDEQLLEHLSARI